MVQQICFKKCENVSDHKPPIVVLVWNWYLPSYLNIFGLIDKGYNNVVVDYICSVYPDGRMLSETVYGGVIPPVLWSPALLV